MSKSPKAERVTSNGSLGSTGGIGLQTSGKMLRDMLEKSGARHKTEGAEKLDFLVWLADQVVYCIENRRKMQLRFEELTEFLARERAMPAGDGLDPKGAVSGLLALRTREISRLRYDEGRLRELDAMDETFKLSLADMPAGRVNSIFDSALMVYEESRTSPSSSSLPGQVSSPRSAADQPVRQSSKNSKNRDSSSLRRSANPTIDTDEASQPVAEPGSQRGSPAKGGGSSSPSSQRKPSRGSEVSGRDSPGNPMAPRASYTLMPGVPPPPACPPPVAMPSTPAQPSTPAAASKRCVVM